MQVRGQDHHPIETLDPLQQVDHLLVQVAVVGVLGFRAFAKQGVGLVNKLDPIAPLGLLEHPPDSSLFRRCTSTPAATDPPDAPSDRYAAPAALH